MTSQKRTARSSGSVSASRTQSRKQKTKKSTPSAGAKQTLMTSASSSSGVIFGSNVELPKSKSAMKSFLQSSSTGCKVKDELIKAIAAHEDWEEDMQAELSEDSFLTADDIVARAQNKNFFAPRSSDTSQKIYAIAKQGWETRTHYLSLIKQHPQEYAQLEKGLLGSKSSRFTLREVISSLWYCIFIVYFSPNLSVFQAKGHSSIVRAR